MRHLQLFSQIVTASSIQVEHPTLMRHYNFWKRTLPKNVPLEDLSLLALRYVQEHTPSDDQINLTSLLPDYNFPRLAKWLKSIQVPFSDTLYGICLSPTDTDMVLNHLDNDRPLHPCFETICSEYHISPKLSDYYRFKKTVPSHLLSSTTNHPLYPTHKEFYHQANHDCIKECIQRWCILYKADHASPHKGYITLSEAAEKLWVSADYLLSWIENYPAHFLTENMQVMVSETFVAELITKRNVTASLPELINTIVIETNARPRTAAKSFIFQRLQVSHFSWLVSDTGLPGIKPFQYFWTLQQELAQNDLIGILDEFPQLPLKALTPITELSLPQLQLLADNGHICCTITEDKYLLSNSEYRSICRLCEKYIALDDAIQEILVQCNSLFDISSNSHRSDLLDYIKHSSARKLIVWGKHFPMNSRLSGYLLRRADIPSLANCCCLWLAAYKRSNPEKIELLLAEMEKAYPETAKSVRTFLQSTDLGSPAIDMLDTMLFCLKRTRKELSHLSELELEETYIHEFCSKSIVSATLFANYLFSSGYTAKIYSFDPTGYHQDVSAYPFNSFVVIVAAVVNDEFWAENHLVEKALDNPRFASLWVYISLHIFSAWRSTDYVRLPYPLLKYSPEETLQRIRNRTYSENDARYVTETFIHRLNAHHMHPNKTKHAGDTPQLYFHCPESCKSPWGVVLSIAAAHQQMAEKAAFIKPVTDINSIKQFFGPTMAAACGNKNFSGRRANKALMQSIELHAQESKQSSPYTAHVLASLVRAHKSSYGTLAETTARYLKDANFSGYTPEYIAWQMMERGVCSFAVDRLLEECYGNNYKQLPVADKTEVIQSMDLPTLHLDNIIRYTQIAETEAITAIRNIHNDPQHAPIHEMLLNIANGHAPGKQQNSMCLCTAAGLTCRDPHRINCLGCLYEVKSKAILLQYMDNYMRLSEAARAPQEDSSIVQERAAWLLQNKIGPAIAEIMTYLKGSSSAEEFATYAAIIQERRALECP